MKTIKAALLQLADFSDGKWILQIIGIGVGWVSSFFLPIKQFMFTIGILVMCDLLTGWRKSAKLAENPAQRKINSAGIGKTLEKSLLYLALMTVTRALDISNGLTGPVDISHFIGGIVMAREALSNMENIDAVLGTSFAKYIKEKLANVGKKNGGNDKDQPISPVG